MSEILKKFKFWSNRDKSAKEILRPDLGMREWKDLNSNEKTRIWNYLKSFFENEEGRNRIFLTIWSMNEANKYNSYGERFLDRRSSGNAFEDFKEIFMRIEQNVLIELLDHFCKAIFMEKNDKNLIQHTGETNEDYNKRNTAWKYEEFDKFQNRLNDVFGHFGINVILTRTGFIFKQEEKIITEIYEPVLSCLSEKKFKDVNRELKDAFVDYSKNTPSGYSSCITHSIASIEAYLQILIYNKTGTDSLATLINKAISKNLIPNDMFSKQVFCNLKSILAKERKETGDAHPKQEYANAKNAKLILNLTMVFLQHCIQYE